MLSDKKMNELLDTIQASNKSLIDICESCDIKYEDLTIEELNIIDENYTQCDECGWWIDSDDIVYDNVCISCCINTCCDNDDY